MSETPDVIKVEGLTKVFNRSLTAVDHINFSVKGGEILFSGAKRRKQNHNHQNAHNRSAAH